MKYEEIERKLDNDIFNYCWIYGLKHQFKSRIDAFGEILTYFAMIPLEEL